ncbi:hypothetical protein ACNKHQ_22610 [Shigella flexneri]
MARSPLHQRLPADWLLSAGLIYGRHVWRADLTEEYSQVKALVVNVTSGSPLLVPCCIALST